GAEQAPCGEVAGVWRYDQLADLELAGEETAEEGARATERHQPGSTRIVPLLDRDLSDRVRHVRRRNPQDTPSDLFDRVAEPLAERLERRARPCGVQCQTAREHAVREHPQHERGVR